MPDTLGVIGGGQLGRYFVLAARSLGFRTMVLEPDPHSPAGIVADTHLIASYNDEASLQRMAHECSGVTIEFENAPTSALDYLAQHVVTRPAASAVAITQDRRREKEFCTALGLAVAPYTTLSTAADLAADSITFPAVLKTAQLGYDGKGQRRVASRDMLASAWNELGSVPCVVEQLVALQAEFSIILARSHDGAMVTYAPTLNTHVEGILDASVAPLTAQHLYSLGVQNATEVLERATHAARRIADELTYVGVLGVECFVANDNVLINELAPRPHNSGHWTIDAAHTSQFEQQVRTLAGLPLGDTSLTSQAVAMVNLLGDRWKHGEPNTSAVAADNGEHLHTYGKREARPGRKMGHLTVCGDDVDSVLGRACGLRDHFTASR